MSSIDDIRQRFPEDTDGKSDSEVIYMVSRVTGLSPVQVAKDFGIQDPENAPRGFLGAANDAAINFGNSAAGIVGSVAEFVAPGNSFSKGVDEFIEDGRSKLSLRERLSQDRFNQALNTDDIGTQFSGVIDRVVDDPVQALAQAGGSFVPLGIGIKGAQVGARALGVGTRAADNAIDAARNVGPIMPKTAIDVGTKAADKAIERVGLGTGMLLSGSAGGGDAAGTAYDLVLQSTGDEELALKAAREASIAPFAVGLATGAFGAEKVLSRVGSQPLGKGASILGTAGVEAGTEFVEEGVTAYSGRKVASLYDDTINPMTGVFGQALMGAVQGGMVGGSVALLDKMGRGAENAAISRAINGYDPTQDPSGMPYLNESAEEKAARFKQMQDEKLAQQQAEKEAAAKLAAANQQNNQAQQQGAQQNQQAQTVQQLYDQFGVRPVLDPQTNQPVGKFMLGDKIFFTEGDAMTFAKGLTEAGKDLSPAQQSLVGKLFAGGVVPVKATDTAKGLISKASKFMQDTQLASAADMNDVVSRIDQIIEAVAPKTDLIGGKMSKDAEMLTSLDKLRKSITGEASTRLGEIADQQTMSLQQQEAQKAAKAAKGGKQNSATKAATPGNAQTSGGPNGQQQSAPGMGEVSEQGSAGGTVSPANGDAGSPQVQPVGSGSVAGGSNGQQNDAGRGAGNEQRTVQPTADGAPTAGRAQAGSQEVNPVYARYSSLTPAQQKQVSDITRIKLEDLAYPGVVANNEQRITEAMDRVAPLPTGESDAGQQTEGSQTQTDQGGSGRNDSGGVAQNGSQGVSAGRKSRRNGTSDTTDSEGMGREEESAEARESRERFNAIKEKAARSKFILRTVFEKVFIKYGGAAGRANAEAKVKFFERFYLNRDEYEKTTLNEVAADLGVPASTVREWSRDLKLDKNTQDLVFNSKYKIRMERAFAETTQELNLTPEELYDAVGATTTARVLVGDLLAAMDLEALVDDVVGPDASPMLRDLTKEAIELAGGTNEDETVRQKFADESSGEEDSSSATGRKNSSVTVFEGSNEPRPTASKNIGESIAVTFEGLKTALDDARTSGTPADIDKAQERLDAFVELVPQLERQAARAHYNPQKETSGKEKSADGEQSEDETDFDAEVDTQIEEVVRRRRAKAKADARKGGSTKSRDTKEMAAAAARWKEVGGDVTQLTDSELEALLLRAQRFNNTPLAAKIDAELESRGVVPAKQEAKTQDEKSEEQAKDVGVKQKQTRNTGRAFAAFKRSYAQGSADQMRENPNLTDAAEYADWLNSLTDKQQDIIAPQFEPADNPFLVGLNNVDPAASRAKFQKMLEAKIKTSEQQYEDLVGSIPGAPAWNQLTAEQQDKLRDLAQRDQLNLAAIDKIVGAQPNNLNRLTGEPSVFGSEPARVKSLSRGITELRKRLDNNEITPEEFADQVEKLHDRVNSEKLSKDVPARVRGADYIRQRLLEAKRRGELSDEAVDMAEWFILKNPDLVEDLAVSVTRSKRDGVAGYYNTFNRMMRLFKDVDSDQTVVHEILHHLERMMPAQIQVDIRRAWMASLVNARKMAQRGGNEDLVKFYDALLQYHIDGKTSAMEEAQRMLVEGKVGYAHYQHVNPSEFWAVNGAAIVADRFAATRSVTGRIKQWLKELVQKLKDVFGLRSNAPIIRALDSLAKSDGKFITSRMLDGQRAGQYNMFVGTSAANRLSERGDATEADINRVADLLAAKMMDNNGESADSIWRSTGWYKGPEDKWRFELSDTGAKFKRLPKVEAKQRSVADYLEHTELFKAYPGLKKAKIVFYAARTPEEEITDGGYDSGNNLFEIRHMGNDTNRMLSTLLHEVQHWVQIREGFSPGDSPSNYADTGFYNELDLVEEYLYSDASGQYPQEEKDLALSALDELRKPERRRDFKKQEAQLENTWLELTDAWSELDALKVDFKRERDNLAQLAEDDPELDALLERSTKLMLRIERAVEKSDTLDTKFKDELRAITRASEAIEGFVHLAFFRYVLSHGEVEARNTQDRRDLTDADRREINPQSTEDTPQNFLRRTELRGAAVQKALSLSLPQQRRIDRNLERVPKKARQFFSSYSKAAGRLLNHLRFTTHMLEQVGKRIPAAQMLLNYIRKQNAIRSAKLYEVEKITKAFDKLKKPEQDKVNSIIMRSTSTRKWAFQPSWVSADKTKMDEALVREFDQLPDDAQRVIRDVFAHGYTTMMELRQSVSEIMAGQYDERIAQARKAGDLKLVDELQTEKDTALGDYIKLFEMSSELPYSPLRRYGNHVVVYRSAEMMDAMDVLDAVRDGEDIPEADLKAVRKFIRENEGDPEHYQVYFREGALEAERLADELREELGDGVQQFTRDEAAQKMYMSPDVHGVMYRLRKKANDAANEVDAADGAQAALNKILSELHLTLLSEQSARHAEHRRAEGTVTGADQNMMRAFHSHGLATSSLIASLSQSENIQKALEKFERDATSHRNPEREKDSAIYNEVAARYALGLDSGDTPFTDKILRYNSAWMLLSRPLYYLQNGMQPWMISAPYMAGKHGAKAYSEMLATYKELSPILLAERVTADMLEKLPVDAKRVVYEMLDNGMLSVSLDQDMGDRLRGANPVDNFITKMQGVAERVEGLNRVVTAVTAYRLERKSGVGHGKAIAYADEVVYNTHGDYSGFNAPRIMRNQVGRVLTQFRKFQLIQIGAMVKLFREAFGKASTPDEKFIARRGLMYVLGSAVMFGGATAFPGFAAAAWIIGKVFGEDDEPNDPEAQLARARRMIGDPDLADLFLEGIPKAAFGFDGEPIFGGWGNMLSLIPYTKVEGSDRRTYADVVLGVAGPLVGGLGPKMADGVGKLAEGDITGGLQRVLPTGVGNVIKAMELQDKGLTRSAGAEILSPEDVSAFTSFMQAIGLRTNEVADKQFINRVTTTYESFYREQSQKIKRQYSEAFEKGDSRKMAEARELWTEMNDSRRRNGFDVQPYSSLIKAPQQARKYERRINNQLDTTGRELAGMR